jgi:hypothetical protein
MKIKPNFKALILRLILILYIQGFDLEFDKVNSLIDVTLNALNDPYITDNDKMNLNYMLGVRSSYILRQNAKTDAILILDVKTFIKKTIDYIKDLENLKLNKKKYDYSLDRKNYINEYRKDLQSRIERLVFKWSVF